MDTSDTQAAQAEAYRKMTATLVDFLFDVNAKLAQDMNVIIADDMLTVDHKEFALLVEGTRREALADLCAMLSEQEVHTLLPTAFARQWLMEQMLFTPQDGESEYLWLGFKYVDNMVRTFEREFEKKLAR